MTMTEPRETASAREDEHDGADVRERQQVPDSQDGLEGEQEQAGGVDDSDTADDGSDDDAAGGEVNAAEKDEEEDFFVDMSDDEFKDRYKESLAFKDEGNRLFKAQDYVEALELYTKAINNCCTRQPEVAAFFNNRAACQFQLEDYEQCVEDCSHAMALKPPYVKALVRRAQAYEKLEKLEDALQDYKDVLTHDPRNKTALAAVRRLPDEIKEQQEKMKQEMFAKLKDLGNMCLRPFGLSTDNFQMVQDPNTGSYSVNFVNGPNASSSSSSSSASASAPAPQQPPS